MTRNRTFEITDKRIARFWAKVNRQGANDCWEWTGERHDHGYGLYSEWGGDRRTLRMLAHRIAVLLDGRQIDGLVVRHDCDNPPCVNPRHLRTGTQADNVRDAVERQRMDTSGLAIGRSDQYPPRPCKACGISVTEGRRRLCAKCRAAGARESQLRYNRKRRTPRAA